MALRSPWLDADQPLPALAHLPRTASTIVVGGGVVGAATLYFLARQGGRPLLLEAQHLAAGASGHNGGLLVGGAGGSYRHLIEQAGAAAVRELWGFTEGGVGALTEIVVRESLSCDLQLSGHWELLSAPPDAGLQAEISALQHDDFERKLLGREELQAAFGLELGALIQGAIWQPNAGQLHSGRLVRGLIEAAQRYGAHYMSGVRVEQIRAEPHLVELRTSAGTIQAEKVVSALNGWSRDLLPMPFDQIEPVRGQVLLTQPLPHAITGGFGMQLSATGEYGQQLPDGRILFGGCRAVAEGADRNNRSSLPSRPVQAALDHGLTSLFPSLAQANIQRRWAGTMGFSPDHLPLVGWVNPERNWLAVGGFSGHGMPYAAPIGLALANAARTGELQIPSLINAERLLNSNER